MVYLVQSSYSVGILIYCEPICFTLPVAEKKLGTKECKTKLAFSPTLSYSTQRKIVKSVVQPTRMLTNEWATQNHHE